MLSKEKEREKEKEQKENRRRRKRGQKHKKTLSSSPPRSCQEEIQKKKSSDVFSRERVVHP